MNTDLDSRIKRLYSALNVMVENDIAKAVVITEAPGRIHFSFDGGMSDADLQNAAMTLVGLVAHLPEHLKRWLRENNISVVDVDEFVKGCDEFKILADLWDRDKHGGASRDGGFSKRSPRIASLSRGLQSRADAQFTMITLSYGPNGSGLRTVEGSPQVVIDGNVIDGSGAKLGDLAKILDSAFSRFESLFNRYGIPSADA